MSITLSLCMITYEQDAQDLQRCLESVTKIPGLLDEIIIVDTSKEPSSNIKLICDRFERTRLYHRAFEDDFSKVRNYSFDQATSDYLMWCFTPETRVHTLYGLKPISEIEVGECVLTHNGRYMPVTKKYVQDYSGEIRRVSALHSEGTVGVTPNHEFYGHRQNNCKTGVKFCKPDCRKQYSKRYLRSSGKLCRQCKQGYSSYNSKYTPISDYSTGDIVSFPRLRQTIFTPYYLEPPTTDTRARQFDKIEVTPDFMRLLGYYAAEGTAGESQVNFCFHAKEKFYHEDVTNLMMSIFKIDGNKIYKDGINGGGCTINFNSVILAKFFRDITNGLQPQRRIPPELLGLSDQHLSEFIKGYYRGDGGENPDSFAITTSSPYLAEQTRVILSRFGIMAQIIPYKTKKAWKIRIGGKSVSIFERIISEVHSKFLKSEFNKNYYYDSSFLYQQIDEYETEQYNGLVYNLEVEEDHTYVTEYMLSHNCDSDDIITLDQLTRIKDLKTKLSDAEVWIMDYVYSIDEHGKPALVLPRERVVKKGLKWVEVVHECIDILGHSIIRTDIKIEHHRSRGGSPERNLKILLPQYQNKTISERSKFYLGKELMDSGRVDEGATILQEYLTTGPGKDFADNLLTACLKLAQYYAIKADITRAKVLALRSHIYSTAYAEIEYLLGEIYEHQCKYTTALEYYRQALGKRLGTGGMSQLPAFYHYLPHRALALLYSKLNDKTNARKHATIALSQKDDPELARLAGPPVEVKAAWLFPGIADPINGSQRIRRINLHKSLPESKIIECYLGLPYQILMTALSDRTVVVFQNFCEVDYWLIRLLNLMGKVTLFDDCEGISGYPWQSECMQAVTAVTCCSTKLAERRQGEKIAQIGVVADAWESAPLKTSYTQSGDKPVALFIGMGGNSFLVRDWLGSTIEASGYKLIVCSEWDDADIKWHPDTWRDTMLSADVVLCPQRVDVQPAKSNVKVTQAMSMGIPVIASPLQAYLEIIRHGENGYIAADLKEWGEALEALKDDKTRERIGRAGLNSVSAYSIDAVSSRWQAMVKDLILNTEGSTIEPQKHSVATEQEEPVDLIIPVYNNLEYLKLTLDSIRLNTIYPYRIILSDAGSGEDVWSYLRALRGMTVLGDPKIRLSFSEAVNAGILQSSSKYFAVLNSDIIVSKGWLTNIIKKMKSEHRLACCGVLSNCDDRWLINSPGKPDIDLKINGSLVLHPGMKMAEVKPYLDGVYTYMEESNVKYKDTFVSQDWVAAYASVYAKSAIDEVGLFDPLYANGCEDLDMGKRLSAFGYRSGQSYDSFVLHFGGVSRYHLQSENKEAYNKDDILNHHKYSIKWKTKKVAIYTGPAWEPWTPTQVEEGMAGSESWACYIAREFVKLGYETTVYGHLKDPETMEVYDGVRYIDHRKMLEDLKYKYVDLFISSRTVEPIKHAIHALKHYVMIHDVFVHPDPHHDLETWRTQKYLYLSPWHKEFLQHHHKTIPEDKMVMTANGVAPYYWDKKLCIQKSNRAVYSSSPDRGLYQLLLMLPEIRRGVPDFEVDVAYGFFNWESAVRARNDIAGQELIDKIKILMDQPGVVYHDRVPKRRLYELQMRAKVWLYPTWFDETFGITAIENRLAGNAIITTGKAGLLRTAGPGARLISPACLSRDAPYPNSYTSAFLSHTIGILTDEDFRGSMVEAGYEGLEEYRWDSIATKIIDGI